MKLGWTLAAALIVTSTTGVAHASSLDLSSLITSPQEILDIFAPERERRRERDEQGPKEPPKACTDAALTEDQKNQIRDAAHQAMRDKVQIKADLKIAFMDYQKTAMDQNSDKATADTQAGMITEAIKKLSENHLKLSNHILYDIAKPEQRANVFLCMKAMHKKHRGHRR